MPGRPAGRPVEFAVGERCFAEGEKTCNEDDFTSTDPGRSRVWYDTPSTLYCASGKRCGVSSPTFWSRKRLSSITTWAQRTSGSTAYSKVDVYNLAQDFPKTLVDGSPPLWLESITRTGYAADGTTTTLPAVSFMHNNEPLPNRVVTSPSDPRPAFDRLRIRTIVTETGGDIDVEYSAPCAQGTTHPSPSANGTRCYPVYWSPDDNSELEWFNKYVVTAVTQKDRVGGAPDLVTSYEYVGDAAWAKDQGEFTEPNRRTWNQWRGYSQVITRQGATDSSVAAEATVRTQTATRYFRGMDGDPLPNGGKRNEVVNDSQGAFIADDSPALQGQVAETLTYSADAGSVATRTVNHPSFDVLATRVLGVDDTSTDRPGDDLDDLHSYRTQVDETDTITASSGTFTGTGSYPADTRTSRTTRTLTTYDSTYGLPTQVETQGDTGRTGDESCTTTSYVHNTTAHLIGLPKEVRTTAGTCADAAGAGPDDVMSDVRTAYDGGAVGDAPSKGLPTTVQSIDGDGTNWITTARTTYDALGRVKSAKDAKDTTTSTDYSPASGQTFSTSTTNPLGTATVTIDPGRGLPLTSTDVNGKITRSAYDGLGRLTSGWSPSRSSGVQSANVTYDYQVKANEPVAVTTHTLRDNGSYDTSVTLYDGLLRPRQTQSEAVGGGRLISDTLYNASGSVRRTNSPYLGKDEPDPSEIYTPDSDFSVPQATETAYDGRGRAIKTTTLHDGTAAWSTSTTYGADYTTVIPPTGGTATRTWTDALGRTLRNDYFTDAARTVYTSTSYGYDPRGNRTSVTDAKGNTWSYNFDARGRQTAAIDPDTGSTTTAYDTLDRPYKTISPLGTLYTVYDSLGRVSEIHDDSATGTLRVKRTYDTLPGAKGQPVASTRYEDGQPYTTEITGYDAEYRPTGRKITIPSVQTGLAGTYTWGYTYTPTGQIQTTTMPAAGSLAAETVVTRYNDDDLPITTSGSTWYTAGTEYSPYGEALRTVSGPAPYRVWTTNVIDPTTGRLERTITDRETATHRLYDRTYTYDNAGNPTSITDKDSAGTVDRQCYSYDARAQLTNAWTSTDPNCAKTSTTPGAGPTTATVTAGSGDGYWQEFQYDAIGNRTKLIEHSTARTSTGALDTSKDITRTATYGNADLDATPGEPSDGGPHTLSALDSQVGTTGTSTRSTYRYDNAGNTTSRESAGDTQTLDWTTEGQLASVTGYLADGQGPITGLAGKCIDLTSSSTTDGTALQIYSCNGTTAQQFKTHGQTLTVLGKCAQAMGTADAVAIQLFTCDGGTDQTWQHRADGSLYNPASGKCLAIPASNTTNGTDLILYTCNGAGSQNWNIGDTTSYLYDADGNRLISTTATGRTLYLGDTELSVGTDSSLAYTSRYYTQPGAPTVVRTARGDNAQKLGVLLADQLGTATTAVDLTAGQAVSTRKFLPYGEERGTTPTAWPDHRGYLGGNLDQATSLTHLGAREYDPSTGRFISADPLVDFTDPLSMNGYTYADNNPIAHSDPTGQATACLDTCGAGDHYTGPSCLGPTLAAGCDAPDPGCEPWCAPQSSASSSSQASAPSSSVSTTGTGTATGPAPKKKKGFWDTFGDVTKKYIAPLAAPVAEGLAYAGCYSAAAAAAPETAGTTLVAAAAGCGAVAGAVGGARRSRPAPASARGPSPPAPG